MYIKRELIYIYICVCVCKDMVFKSIFKYIFICV